MCFLWMVRMVRWAWLGKVYRWMMHVHRLSGSLWNEHCRSESLYFWRWVKLPHSSTHFCMTRWCPSLLPGELKKKLSHKLLSSLFLCYSGNFFFSCKTVSISFALTTHIKVNNLCLWKRILKNFGITDGLTKSTIQKCITHDTIDKVSNSFKGCLGHSCAARQFEKCSAGLPLSHLPTRTLPKRT